MKEERIKEIKREVFLHKGRFPYWCVIPNDQNAFVGLVYQGKDIVFRFIIEYSSLREWASPLTVMLGASPSLPRCFDKCILSGLAWRLTQIMGRGFDDSVVLIILVSVVSSSSSSREEISYIRVPPPFFSSLREIKIKMQRIF
jgi:hypothetical protein